MKRRIIVALLSLCAVALPVKAQEADSLSRCWDESFRASQLIAPAIFIGSGSAITFIPWFETNVSLPVRDFVVEQNLPSTWVDHVTAALPSVAYIGMNWIGVASEHTGKERIATLVTASAIQMGVVRGLKHALDVVRPDGSNDHSFPSNHSSWAFMGAELVRIEYGPWWGLGAYSVATATALMRVYNNKHWVGDILAGAGIGILSAQAAYWLLPLERKLFGWKPICTRGINDRFMDNPSEQSPAVILVPYAAPGAAGFSFALTF